MKKLLFVALAAVGMTACVQNEELVVPQNTAAITFADAYVSNATKADPTTTTDSIEDFDVWAFMDEATGVVLADEDVTKNGGVWGYYNTQYWFPNHTYYFAALSPMESANVSETLATGDDAKLGLGTVAFTNVDGTEDLLYAKAKVTTPDAATLANQGMPAVALQFQHLLSKVKFTFLNGFTTNNVTVAVSNVKMVAPKSATINLAQADYSEAWVLGNETLDLEFGATEVLAATASGAAANERLTIPAAATQVYEVTFDVLVKVGDQEAMTEHKSAVIEGLALEMGKAYNFTAVIDQTTLGLHAIEFTASVEDWADGVATDVIKGKAISTAAELAEAVKTSGEYVLVNDIAVDADATMTVAAGNHVVLYLNGHTLTAQSDETSSNRNAFDVRGNLVVKGGNETYTRNAAAGTIAYKHVGTNMGWGYSINIFNVTAGGVLELEGVTASVEGSDMAFVAHLNNWGEVTLIANNCTLESNYVPVRVFNSGPDMNNVTIKNSTLKGGSAAFWVHNYTVADFGTEAKAEAQKALLNLNIYNQDNTFSPDVNGIRYGFTNSVRSDAYGITKSVSDDGSVVTLGSVVEDGLVRRGVVGAEENTTIKKVVVGEGITTLYDRTFRRFYALEEVILPSTLTTIGAAGSGVFQSCTNLKSVVIPESVTVLGKGSFQECSSLESINIPAGVTRIEENCLRATGIKKIEFHEGVTYFGAQAFRDCKQLKEVTINAPQFTIEANCFGSMAAPYPAFTIYVANAEMKAYLESTLAYQNQFKVVAQSEVATEEALADAVANGGYIVLGDDITLAETLEIAAGKEVSLNLNGKTITAPEANGYAVNNVGGKLTIEGDGVVNGIVYTEGSETIINGGTFNALNGGAYVLLNSQGTLTINQATINGGTSYPVYSYNAGNKLVINDATINATFGCVNSYGLGGVVEINGGTFQMTGVQGKTSHIAYFSNVDATINGGTFKKIGDISMSGVGGGGVCVIYGANVTINGGTFAGDYADVYNWGGTNANGRATSFTIEGGSFKFKPSNVAEGHAATQNGDGTWTVQ